MLSFLEYLEEIFQRIDTGLKRRNNRLTNFSTNQPTSAYRKTPGGEESGRVGASHTGGWNPSRVKYKRIKATYAGKPEFTAPYAAKRGVPFTTHQENGKNIITYDKKDEKAVRNNRPILSTWSDRDAKKANFKTSAGDEVRSKTPGRPTSQKIINDPVKHMQDQGHEVRFVDDIKAHRQDLQNRGIEHGAEGL